MKYRIYSLVSLVTLTTTALATPLQQDLISADAKWLIHLDLDALRATKLGQFLDQQIISKEVAKHQAEAKQSYGVDLDWTKLHAVTAYGTDYQIKPEANGVLIVSVDPNMESLVGLALDKQADKGVLARVGEGRGLYSIHGQILLLLEPEGQVFIGKSKESLQKAREVAAGKAPNLRESRAFSGYPGTPKPFFFLAVAEGLGGKFPAPHRKSEESRQGDSEFGFAPKAQLLQMANGGRLVLGEKAENLFFNLTLKAKTDDTARQMQQILQGILALVSLSQGQNQELMQLAQATRVTGEANMVTVGVEYPVDKALEALSHAPGNLNFSKPGAAHTRERSARTARRDRAARDSDGSSSKPAAEEDKE